MKKINDIKMKNTFGVPEGYFDSLKDQIQTGIIEEKLKEEYGNKHPFIVPDDYFEKFSLLFQLYHQVPCDIKA